MSKGGVGRRVEGCLRAAEDGDFELAFLQLAPALDFTAKRRRPRDRVGDRFRSFLADEEFLISYIATGLVLVGNRFEGVTFPEAIYKFARNPLIHEGTLDPRLRFTHGGGLSIGSQWWLPDTFIRAMCVATIAAPENARDRLESGAIVHCLDAEWDVDDLWGRVDLLEKRIVELDPELREFVR